jgi:hypothetical protein
MSQQAHLWSRYHAAALQTHEPESAAKKADAALAEYNKRFETLAKHEHEMIELARLLAVREEQVYIGTRALMAARDLEEAIQRDGVNAPQPFWREKLTQLATRHLRVVEGTWTIVPDGMHENDPKLRRHP